MLAVQPASVITKRPSSPEVPSRQFSSLEDDDEKTMVGASLSANEGATQAFTPLQLKVIEGADLGRQVPISTSGMLLGRGDDCDFQLQDGAASRRHAELLWTSRGIVLRDLGSGNGTKVNGEKISTDLLIQEGDRITIGLTVIEIIDSLNQASSFRNSRALDHRAPPLRGSSAFEEDDSVDEQIELRRKTKKPPIQLLMEKLSQMSKKQRIIAASIICGLVVLLWSKSFVQDHIENKRQEEIQRAKEAEAQLEQQFSLAVTAGKKALYDRRPSDALQRFQEALDVFPDRSKSLDREIRAAERDQKAEVHLKKVKALQAEERFEEAIAALQEIDSLSGISDLVPNLQKELERQLLEAQKKEIRTLLEDREIDKARQKIMALPSVEMPLFLDLLDEAAKQAKIEAADSKRQSQMREQDRKRQAQQRQTSEITQAIAPIVAKIDRADFKGAQKDLDTFNTRGKPSHVVNKINQLRKLLPKFQKDYSLGNSQYLGKNYEQAAEPLARAWNTWKSMDINGKLGDKLHAQAAESLENKGRSAMQRKDYVAAGKAFKETLKFNRNSKVASNGLNEIIRKAQDIYLQGYTEMRSNPSRARQLFEQVIAMTPSDSEVHKNAQNRKREIDKGF